MLKFLTKLRLILGLDLIIVKELTVPDVFRFITEKI